MSEQPQEPCPLLLLLLLHFVAACACFTFFTVVPIASCLVLMVAGSDPGGPMFFPILVVGVLLSAAVIAAMLTSATLLSDLLRRHCCVPVWLPPVAVLLLATVVSWLSFSEAHPAVPLIVGGVIALAFTIHWSAISTLRLLLVRLFSVYCERALDHARKAAISSATIIPAAVRTSLPPQ